MAKLIFEGDEKQLKIIAKESRLRTRKHSLKVTLELEQPKRKEVKKEAAEEAKKPKTGQKKESSKAAAKKNTKK